MGESGRVVAVSADWFDGKVSVTEMAESVEIGWFVSVLAE
jgi:hypothetical protein